ncbi:MAG: GvpL/GvpF family gas vesicle protein [Thaumarchaeota archaeon]|nr:GvpL/GvpF family gas vesicle protein [Nitrososphaerota archaeon]
MVANHPGGRYLYCITETTDEPPFEKPGLFGKRAFAIPYKDICAVVSNVPLKEMRPDAETITAHQMVVEESRSKSTTLPVRFGIMFKSDDNVKSMLAKSYKDLKSKMDKIRGKDEFGLKIIVDHSDLKKISILSGETGEIKKMKKEMKTAGKGTAYFIKMRMDEAIRNETYRRMEQMSRELHDEIGKACEESSILRSDFDEILLNAAYLVDRKQSTEFHKTIEGLRGRYKTSGLVFHLSGPWAPYSFC